MIAVLAALAHGLGLAALAGAIGGLVVDLAIMPTAPAAAAARARLRRFVTACLALLLLAAIAEIVVRTQAMSRAPLAAAIAAVPDVVRRTHLGALLALRAAGVALALLLSLTSVAAFRAAALLIGVGAALTMSLTGHAVDWGDLTVSVAVDWAHAVGESAWAGGLLALAMSVLRGPSGLSPDALAAVARRFSRLAGGCLPVVVASGIYNAWAQLGGVSRLWTTTYGRVLLVKVALAIGLIWLGAMNRYLVVSQLGGGRGGPGRRIFRLARLALRGPRRGPGLAAPRRFSSYVTREAIVALLVFACTAALAEVPPARHTAFERKPSSHVTNVAPAAGGGTKISGTVMPPRGEAATGRAVYAKLKCFECHAIPGERFPTPSRPGPGLAGVGRQHPGYLLESIVNPNARIVDGPGYTDDRGLSTMPDYRDALTVGELIDLVAYLRTLAGEPPPSN